MKLEEAIRILTLNLPTDSWNRNPKQFRALQLGIEALKDKIKARTHGHAYSHRLLPGETEE